MVRSCSVSGTTYSCLNVSREEFIKPLLVASTVAFAAVCWLLIFSACSASRSFTMRMTVLDSPAEPLSGTVVATTGFDFKTSNRAPTNSSQHLLILAESSKLPRISSTETPPLPLPIWPPGEVYLASNSATRSKCRPREPSACSATSLMSPFTERCRSSNLAVCLAQKSSILNCISRLL